MSTAARPRAARLDKSTTAQQIGEFIRAHGRLPRAGGQAARTEEARLGAVLRDVRARHRRGALSDAWREQLDQHAPGWDVAGRKGWSQSAIDDRRTQIIQALVAYRDEHGRLPRKTDPDGHGAWLDRRRWLKRRGELDAALDAQITAALGEDWAEPYTKR